MSKIGNVIPVVCCLALCAMADIGILLSGTVKNGEDVAIVGASVMLVSDTSTKYTTSANGEFSISGMLAIRGGRSDGLRAPATNRIGIQHNQLRLLIDSPVGNAVVTIFSGNGKRNIESFCKCLGKYGLAGPCRSYEQDIALLKLDIRFTRVENSLVVVMDGNGEDSLCPVLPDDIIIQE